MTVKSTAASPAAEQETETDTEVASATEAKATEPTDAKPADSSDADKTDANEQPENLLDVVKSAVEPKKEAEESSTSGDSQEEDEAKAKGEGEEKPEAKAEAEDDSKLPFHSHPRFQELIRERNELREPAANFNRITGFMQEHGLGSDEVAEGFEIMALLKSGDREKLSQARDWFASRLGALDETLGAVLPADLQDRVDNGLIDEETAGELAKARAAEKIREGRDQKEAERTEQQRQDEARRNSATKMANAVEGWETRIKGSDPDYSKKADMVMRTCRAMMAEEGKQPTNEAEAVALAERAYAKVNEDLKSLLPKPKQVIPAPTGQSATATAAPTSLRGAIEAAVAR